MQDQINALFDAGRELEVWLIVADRAKKFARESYS